LGITLLGHSLMVTYGFLIYQIPIMVNAPIAVCTTLTLIIQKFIYKRLQEKQLKLNNEEDDTNRDDTSTSDKKINILP